jgi:hypothetical protein
MIYTITQAKELAKEYNALKTDEQRLVFLKEQNGNMIVVLDNDVSQVQFKLIGQVEDEVEEIINKIDLNDFDEYHGDSGGVVKLFKFAGIDAEGC